MSVRESHPEITRLLHAWREGSTIAEGELWTVLYDELRSMARSALRHHGGPKIQSGTTSLVHEAFLRLLGNGVDWTDRHHFFAVASRAMRFVLIDEARRQLAGKRGADAKAESLSDEDGKQAEPADPLHQRPEEVLAVHEALEQLARINPRHEQLVELRYFAGLSVEETAEVLGVASRTVVRDWRAVRTWLHEILKDMPPGAFGNGGSGPSSALVR